MIYTEGINSNVGFLCKWWEFLLLYIFLRKNSLNRLALVQRSEKNLPLTNKGGIARIFLLHKNLFIIDHYVLGTVYQSLIVCNHFWLTNSCFV